MSTGSTNKSKKVVFGKAESRQGDHLMALGDLVEKAFPDPTRFFDHGLNLLVQQLGMDRAVMSRHTELGWETFWWALAEGVEPDAAAYDPTDGLGQHLLDHPGRSLVIRDAGKDPTWKDHPMHRKLGIHAYMGAPLREGTQIVGVLSVHRKKPKHFTRPEMAMVNAMANLFSKTLEVENLKVELHQTREALDLTTAVVEDSALETHSTGLPNLHYLEIWLKANLYLARRRGEVMTVAMMRLHPTRENRRSLREVAEALRGEDLLVDFHHETFLLLLPRTPQEGAQILLGRIRAKLGEIPIGATIWNPLWVPDREDIRIKGARNRAHAAMEQSQSLGQEQRFEVMWNLPNIRTEEMVDGSQPW